MCKAHAQWLQTHCQWYPMGDARTHNLTTDSRRIFKYSGGGGVDHLTRHVCPLTKVKRSKIKITRSRNVSAARTLQVGHGWSYQLQTWWKFSSRREKHVTHFLG